MWLTSNLFLALIVSIATWLRPMPHLSEGWIVRYGPDYIGRANADFRGYSLEGYECAGALMSPADLGKVFWVRTDGEWYGPCLSVDVARRIDFYHYVYELEEIVELTDSALSNLGIENGARGLVFVGLCPPTRPVMPQRYAPLLEIDPNTNSHTPSMYPYPKQQRPAARCDNLSERRCSPDGPAEFCGPRRPSHLSRR